MPFLCPGDAGRAALPQAGSLCISEQQAQHGSIMQRQLGEDVRVGMGFTKA